MNNTHVCTGLHLCATESCGVSAVGQYLQHRESLSCYARSYPRPRLWRVVGFGWGMIYPAKILRSVTRFFTLWGVRILVVLRPMIILGRYSYNWCVGWLRRVRRSADKQAA